MNTYKKNEIALYITLGSFILAVGLFTGDYLTYLKMLGVLFGIIGIAFGYYKLVVFILDKVYTEKNTTITKGAISTNIIDYKYER